MDPVVPESPAGGPVTSRKVLLELGLGYVPEDHGLELVQLSPSVSIYQLADPDRYQLLQDGRLLPEVQIELEEHAQYDTSLLDIYRMDIGELEDWVVHRWLSSISALFELAETAYHNPLTLNVYFQKHIGKMARYTAITRRKIRSLYSWFLASRAYQRGPVTPYDIIDSLKSLHDEVKDHYSTLHTLNTRFAVLMKDDPPDGMPSPVFRAWKSALVDGTGLIHDINNLDAALIGFCQLVLDVGMASDRSLDLFFERMRRFTFSSIEGSVSVTQSWLKARADKRGVNVIVKDIPPIEVPEQHRFNIFRAVSELILNGIKYSDKGKPSGKAAYDAGLDRKMGRHVEIETIMDGTLLKIFVRDNGVGMTCPELAFELGRRLRPDLAEGSGYGLAGIRNLARHLNGDLTATSTLGVGTEMMLTIDTIAWHGTGPVGGGFSGGGGYRPSYPGGVSDQTGGMGMLGSTSNGLPQAGATTSLLGGMRLVPRVPTTPQLGVPFLPTVARLPSLR